jgi:hypothetical protein
MESRFGTDFSRVRVHADPLAERSTAGLHAQSYTIANHVVFGPGRYEPHSSAGQALLAHELAHVIQQGNRSGTGGEWRGAIDTSGETEAKNAAEEVARGARVSDLTQSHPLGIQRQLELGPELAPRVAPWLEPGFEFPEASEFVKPEIGIEELPLEQIPKFEIEPIPESITPEPIPFPEPVLVPEPVPAPQPTPVPQTAPEPETEEGKCKVPPVLPPPGPMPSRPSGVRVRLVLPSQKSAGTQLTAYQQFRSTLQHDATYLRGNTAQNGEWDRNLTLNGAHGINPTKWLEATTLGIPRVRILRPNWTKLNANVPTMQVDHVIEMQLLSAEDRSVWGDTFDNYEMLDQRSNWSAGSTIKSNVTRERFRLFQLTCEPRWLTCLLKFDDIVPTPGEWTGARWSRDEIMNGEHVDAWKQLHGAGPAVVPPVVPKPATPAASKPPADFTSTLSICLRILNSRAFQVKNGGLKVTLRARWVSKPWLGPEHLCEAPDYWVSLEKKRLLFDKEIGTSKVPAGKAVSLTWRGLESGDYYLTIFVPESHHPACCLEGDLSVLTFDAPPVHQYRMREPQYAQAGRGREMSPVG